MKVSRETKDGKLGKGVFDFAHPSFKLEFQKPVNGADELESK